MARRLAEFAPPRDTLGRPKVVLVIRLFAFAGGRRKQWTRAPQVPRARSFANSPRPAGRPAAEARACSPDCLDAGFSFGLGLGSGAAAAASARFRLGQKLAAASERCQIGGALCMHARTQTRSGVGPVRDGPSLLESARLEGSATIANGPQNGSGRTGGQTSARMSQLAC